MKFARIILLLAIYSTLSGCSYYYGPREQVRAFITDKDAVLSEITSKVGVNPTLASIAEAQKLLDEKKGSLQEKRQAIDKAEKGFNRDWSITLLESDSGDTALFKQMDTKLQADCIKRHDSCTEVSDKFNELRKSFLIATRLPGYKPDEKP